MVSISNLTYVPADLRFDCCAHCLHRTWLRFLVLAVIVNWQPLPPDNVVNHLPSSSMVIPPSHHLTYHASRLTKSTPPAPSAGPTSGSRQIFPGASSPSLVQLRGPRGGPPYGGPTVWTAWGWAAWPGPPAAPTDGLLRGGRPLRYPFKLPLLRSTSTKPNTAIPAPGTRPTFPLTPRPRGAVCPIPVPPRKDGESPSASTTGPPGPGLRPPGAVLPPPAASAPTARHANALPAAVPLPTPRQSVQRGARRRCRSREGICRAPLSPVRWAAPDR